MVAFGLPQLGMAQGIVKLLVMAAQARIRSSGEQALNEAEVSGIGGGGDRGFAGFPAEVDVGSGLDQPIDDRQMPIAGGLGQSAAVAVIHIGSRAEQGLDLGQVAIAGGLGLQGKQRNELFSP
jgi:hypothetical protein